MEAVDSGSHVLEVRLAGMYFPTFEGGESGSKDWMLSQIVFIAVVRRLASVRMIAARLGTVPLAQTAHVDRTMGLRRVWGLGSVIAVVVSLSQV